MFERLKSALRGRKPAGQAPPVPASLAAIFDFPIVSNIDCLWRDTYGAYIRGWAHAYDRPVTRLVLSTGGAEVSADALEARPDVFAHYSAYPPALHCGFRFYLPAKPLAALALRLETTDGAAEIAVDVPAHWVQDPTAPVNSRAPAMQRLFAHVREQRGTFLEVGGRRVGSMQSDWRAQLGPDARYLSTDIHPAPEVDVVADAHFLSRVVPPGSVAGVFSEAVLEHLVAPWLVAAEVNRVLASGGLTVQVAPHSWPVHEMPNDFWRFSEEGLAILFGPATGFEVLDKGLAHPVYMPPPVNLRSIERCEHGVFPGYMEAWVLARKVREVGTGEVAWPSAGLTTHGEAYPVHG